jgi:hypothetical protein
MPYNEALATLRANLSSLPERQQGFADSLIQQEAGRRGLSEKQWAWVRKLADIATGKEVPAAATVTVGNFAGVIALFAKASQHLKFPKIRLALDDGRPVALAVAGARARKPGTVNVTDGAAYGSNIWYGRVSPDGAWEKGQLISAETETALAALLANLASDPVGVAAKYGKLTGNCCFCNTALSDPRSTAVGYGPICAKHYGLPWKAPAALAADNGQDTLL